MKRAATGVWLSGPNMSGWPPSPPAHTRSSIGKTTAVRHQHPNTNTRVPRAQHARTHSVSTKRVNVACPYVSAHARVLADKMRDS
jgi:hypothetical protein